MVRLTHAPTLVRLSVGIAATLACLSAACSGESEGKSGPGAVDATAGAGGAGVGGAGGGTTPALEQLRLPTADGGDILAEGLQCIYRQAVGADDTLSLQLQFLSDETHVAFAVYLDDPKPATPYDGAAGDDGGFRFEAFADGVGYQSELSNAEITVHLEALPSPVGLQDGQEISLRGSLELSRFDAPEVDALGVIGSRQLGVAPGAVSFACTATFESAEVLN